MPNLGERRVIYNRVNKEIDQTVGMRRLLYIDHRTGFIAVIKFDSIFCDESFKGKEAFKRVFAFFVLNPDSRLNSLGFKVYFDHAVAHSKAVKILLFLFIYIFFYLFIYII